MYYFVKITLKYSNEFQKMQALRMALMNNSIKPHCCPSNREEVQKFMYLPEQCMSQLLSKSNIEINAEEYFNFH